MLGQLGGRNPKLDYERFVAPALGQTSPWDTLKGQIWRGGAAFLKRMAQRVQSVPWRTSRSGNATRDTPQAQR